MNNYIYRIKYEGYEIRYNPLWSPGFYIINKELKYEPNLQGMFFASMDKAKEAILKHKYPDSKLIKTLYG